jgi:3-oxoadipate enol-lactonase
MSHWRPVLLQKDKNMRYQAKIRGSRLMYSDTGKGQTIVFVHGQPFNRSMWDPQVEAFQEQFRLLIPDLRGYGESEVPEKITLLDELALDLLHLLEAVGVGEAIFVGLSMGGQILMELYRLAPQVFRAMVLADTDARAETQQGYYDRLKLAEDLMQTGMEVYTEKSLTQYVSKKTLQEKTAVVAHLEKMMRSTPAQGASLVQRGRAERRDHFSSLRSIHCPVLIVVGREDQFTPVSVAKEMQAQIKGAQLLIIEGASHLPNMEEPDAFNEGLIHFISSSVQGA